MAEGDKCYKFSFMQNRNTHFGEEFKTIIDIGGNTGVITSMIYSAFPCSYIYCFEPVDEYYNIIADKFKNKDNITACHEAITYEHLFNDIFLYYNITNKGGSVITQEVEGGTWDGKSVQKEIQNLSNRFIKTPYKGKVSTLCEVVDKICAEREVNEIDYIKFDCEGSEVSIFNNVPIETLRKIKYMSGEYHCSRAKFFALIEEKLSKTHRCCASGYGNLGTFFFERIDINDGIVKIGGETTKNAINSFADKWKKFNKSIRFTSYFYKENLHWEKYRTNGGGYRDVLFSVLDMLKSNIDNLKDKTLIDIGCGDGVYLVTYSEYFKKIVGIECSVIAADYCRKKSQGIDNVEIIWGDVVEEIQNLPIADISLFINVIEQMTKEEFKHIIENTKTDYVLIVTRLKDKKGMVHDKKYSIYEYFEDELGDIMRIYNFKDITLFNDGVFIFGIFKKSE